MRGFKSCLEESGKALLMLSNWQKEELPAGLLPLVVAIVEQEVTGSIRGTSSPSIRRFGRDGGLSLLLFVPTVPLLHRERVFFLLLRGGRVGDDRHISDLL